jgi:hypothetical protein
MTRLLIALVVLACAVSAQAQSSEILDHPLGDYSWRIRHQSAINAEIAVWYLEATGLDIAVATVWHVNWRAGPEFARWEAELGAPLTLRQILHDIWPREPDPIAPPPPPASHRFVDHGVVLVRGPPGSPSARLNGMISPTRVWQAEGSMWMELIGADGHRPDGGPAHRRLLQTQSRDGGASWSTPVVVQEWSPQGNPEEGVFSATAAYFSAITASNSTTVDVWSDIRTRSGRIVLDHTDRDVWGWGDELFAHSEHNGSLFYIAKGHGVFWGFGVRRPDGQTEQAITGMVIGGGAHRGYVVLVRDFLPGGSRIEWYAGADFSRPIHVSTFGARHLVPYHDGTAWWLYGRTPGDGSAVRRWRLEAPPSVPTNPADELVLSAVTWLHADISEWTQSSTITAVRIRQTGLCVQHTMAGRWPVYVDGGVAGEGNPWIFANIGGQWYGATFEWLRPNQECKGITRLDIGPHTKRSPMATWVPAHGETVGFAMSTPARSNLRTTNQRSNVVLVVWP